VARRLLDDAPTKVSFELHGSFAATGKGHATDRALLAGILGDTADSELLPHSLARAGKAGLQFNFSTIDLGEEVHPNSVRIHLTGVHHQVAVTAASLGGGVIALTDIDGYPVGLNGSRPTLVCWHSDNAGFLSALTALFAEISFNIASLTTSRKTRAGAALTVVEADEFIPPQLTHRATQISGVTRVCLMHPLP
jgi:L-serine dehydratase